MSNEGGARERLIAGCRQLLWDRGYVGTSPTAMMQAAGVGQGSLYHHFAGKAELVLAAEQQTAQDQQREIIDAFAGGGSAFERIAAYLRREREVLRGCPIGRLAADPVIVADEQLREPVRDTFAVLHEWLTRVIAEGQAAGEFRDDLDPKSVALALSAVIQGGYTLARAEAATEPFDAAIEGALALLAAATPPEPAPPNPATAKPAPAKRSPRRPR